MDISRYYLDSSQSGHTLFVNWIPTTTRDTLDTDLQSLGARTIGRFLADRLPESLAHALCNHAGLTHSAPAHTLTREQRRALSAAVCELLLPITGDRGFTYAEATAGGVPLSELRLETMESRICPGLHICGEICDVDGRIGGYNFQWAWASGYTSGVSAGSALN